MKTRPTHNHRLYQTRLPAWALFLLPAVFVHALLALLFLWLPAPAASSNPVQRLDQTLIVTMALPPEGYLLLLMPSADNAPSPPPGQDGQPDALADSPDDPAPATEQPSDEELAAFLASERDRLQAELDELKRNAGGTDLPAPRVPLPAHYGTSDLGPPGAIRKLDLGGYPQSVVDDIMNRYKLRIEHRQIDGGHRGQNFLSSATRGPADNYLGGRFDVPAGIYEVFLLSRESVAIMSRLEEQALKDEGYEPLKARITKIVFGIVKAEDGEYKLGVKSLDAQAVLQ